MKDFSPSAPPSPFEYDYMGNRVDPIVVATPISSTNNIILGDTFNDSRKIGSELEKLADLYREGFLSKEEYNVAKDKVLHRDEQKRSNTNGYVENYESRKVMPSEIHANNDNHDSYSSKSRPPVGHTGQIGIKPNPDERVMIELKGWSAKDWSYLDTIPIPEPLKRKHILTDQEWRRLMSRLRSTQTKACFFPCHWVWSIYVIILITLLLFRIPAFLPLLMLPLGYFLDFQTMFLKHFKYKANKKLEPMGAYLKFQTIKKVLHEVKYLCIAHTQQEITKLKSEPIFQRGTALDKQEQGTPNCCPIGWHRTV